MRGVGNTHCVQHATCTSFCYMYLFLLQILCTFEGAQFNYCKVTLVVGEVRGIITIQAQFAAWKHVCIPYMSNVVVAKANAVHGYSVRVCMCSSTGWLLFTGTLVQSATNTHRKDLPSRMRNSV